MGIIMLKQNIKDAEERPARLKFEEEILKPAGIICKRDEQIPSLYASEVAQAMWEQYKKTI